jgi:hypothetical protein
MIAVGYRMPARINASAQEAIEPDRRDIGPTITGLIDLRDKRKGLVIEELAIPAILRRMFEETVTTFGRCIDWLTSTGAVMGRTTSAAIRRPSIRKQLQEPRSTRRWGTTAPPASSS